jgi:hypothetical protein
MKLPEACDATGGEDQELVKGIKAAREEICKLKTRNVSSNFMQQENSGNWEKPKHSKTRFQRFSANDAGQVQLSNKFSILATDALQVGQQSQVLLKHKDGTRIIHYEDREK